MNLAELIIGIVLIIFAVAAVIWSVVRTPDNLRGLYGLMCWIIALAGIAGGAALIIFSVV